MSHPLLCVGAMDSSTGNAVLSSVPLQTNTLSDYSVLLLGLKGLAEHTKTLRKLHARVLAHNAEVVAFTESVSQVRLHGCMYLCLSFCGVILATLAHLDVAGEKNLNFRCPCSCLHVL